MKSSIDCIPCFSSQAIATLKAIGLPDDEIFDVVARVIPYVLENTNLDKTPAENGTYIYLGIEKELGIVDPYKDVKHRDNLEAKKLVELLLKKFSLKTLRDYAVFSIAGNIIDYGTGKVPSKTIETLEMILSRKPVIDDSESLYRDLSKASRVLYLLDNAGEVVFDMVFMDYIRKSFPNIEQLYIGVKEYPFINDLSIKDVEGLGLEKYGIVVSNGSRFIGNVIDKLSGNFLDIMESVDVIISKGQANFETVSEFYRDNVYFLMVIKCDVVGRFIGQPKGSHIIMYKGRLK